MSRIGIAEVWARSYAEAPECQRAIIGENCQALLDEIERLRKQVADLQAPPTGEEVAKLRKDLIESIGELAAEGYSLGMAEGSDRPDHLEIKSLTASRDESRKECVAAIEKYGAACAAQGRAEAGKAADVLRRLESMIPTYTTWDVLIGRDRDGQPFFATRPIGHGEGATLLDAISAALDQLAAETGRR